MHLLAGCGLLAALLLGALYLHFRYRRPAAPALSARVEGRLLGRFGALSYRGESGELARAQEVLLIEPGGPSGFTPLGGEAVKAAPTAGPSGFTPLGGEAVKAAPTAGWQSVPVIVDAAARGVRAGSFLIADGQPVTLLHDRSLFRAGTSEPALLALRLLVGAPSWCRLFERPGRS